MIIKVFPDKEKAKSIFQMAESRKKFLDNLEKIKAYPTMIAESYYEIIKEFCTAIMLMGGYKAIGENAHKEIIDFIGRYEKFGGFEIEIIQDLRIRRNKSSYEGKPIGQVYLENKGDVLLKIINKLGEILKNRLGNP